MRWTDLLRMSAQNLWRRKLRTILTMVGVMIGTASIVVMVSLGIGINQGYIDSLSETGELTRIQISSQLYWSSNSNAVVYLDDETTVKAQKLDDTMIRKISALDHVESVSPYMSFYNFQVRTGKLQSYYGLLAVNSSAIKTLNFEFKEGGGFSSSAGETLELILGENTLASFRKEGSQVWDNEAPDLDWLNEKFTVVLQDYNNADSDGNPKEYEFKARVVGIVKDNGGDAAYNIYTNIDTMKRIIQKHKSVFKDQNIKTDQYEQCYVRVDDFNNVLDVQSQIKELGIDAWSYAQMIQSMQQQSRSLQLMLGGIGAVAMLVAAISIANTMLMSIYERTKEIGVMKVLGCRMSSIGAMFLCEAAIIGLVGGIVGLAFSYGIGAVVNMVLGASGAYSSFRSVIPLWLCLVGLGFSTMVGVLAGLYPSQRAMRLSALAAIRTE